MYRCQHIDDDDDDDADNYDDDDDVTSYTINVF